MVTNLQHAFASLRSERVVSEAPRPDEPRTVLFLKHILCWQLCVAPRQEFDADECKYTHTYPNESQPSSYRLGSRSLALFRAELSYHSPWASCSRWLPFKTTIWSLPFLKSRHHTLTNRSSPAEAPTITVAPHSRQISCFQATSLIADCP